MTRKFLLIFLLAWCGLSAQHGKVHTSVDTLKNKIGAQFTLTLKAETDPGVAVIFPEEKNFGALEVIRSFPPDTVAKDEVYHLIKKYGLTQFDSGSYLIPRIPVKIGNQTFFSDSLRVEVSNVQVDTLKQKMFDIKTIAEADSPSHWWLYLLILLAVAGAGYVLYRWWKNRKVAGPAKETYKTPIEKATVLLQQLERKELVQRGEVKAYYSELTDIARTYIEEAVHIPAMESTTTELIAKLRTASVKKSMALNADTVANLERVLMHADMVKFAKERPAEFEIIDDRKKIESAIITINSAIPQVPEDDEGDARAELLRQQKIKARRKRKMRRAAIFSGASLAAAVLILFTLSELGFTNMFSSETRRLLDGEWIHSQYGNPTVSLETPKVLKRQDAEKMLDPGAIAILKEFQMFGFGSPTDPIYIQVSTFKYKKDAEISLDTIVEGTLKDWEAKGAQNILVKKEEFTTKAGISGVRAYGTMGILDGILKKSNKLYYEMLFFKQDQGLQQVFISHEEGDEDGQKILERIVESVELQVGVQ